MDEITESIYKNKSVSGYLLPDFEIENEIVFVV